LEAEGHIGSRLTENQERREFQEEGKEIVGEGSSGRYRGGGLEDLSAGRRGGYQVSRGEKRKGRLPEVSLEGTRKEKALRVEDLRRITKAKKSTIRGKRDNVGWSRKKGTVSEGILKKSQLGKHLFGIPGELEG